MTTTTTTGSASDPTAGTATRAVYDVTDVPRRTVAVYAALADGDAHFERREDRTLLVVE